MKPLIVRSDLTTPPRWYVLTRYSTRGNGVICASIKYDVTEQMAGHIDWIRKQKRNPRNLRNSRRLNPDAIELPQGASAPHGCGPRTEPCLKP